MSGSDLNVVEIMILDVLVYLRVESVDMNVVTDLHHEEEPLEARGHRVAPIVGTKPELFHAPLLTSQHAPSTIEVTHRNPRLWAVVSATFAAADAAIPESAADVDEHNATAIVTTTLCCCCFCCCCCWRSPPLLHLLLLLLMHWPLLLPLFLLLLLLLLSSALVFDIAVAAAATGPHIFFRYRCCYCCRRLRNRCCCFVCFNCCFI